MEYIYTHCHTHGLQIIHWGSNSVKDLTVRADLWHLLVLLVQGHSEDKVALWSNTDSAGGNNGTHKEGSVEPAGLKIVIPLKRILGTTYCQSSFKGPGHSRSCHTHSKYKGQAVIQCGLKMSGMVQWEMQYISLKNGQRPFPKGPAIARHVKTNFLFCFTAAEVNIISLLKYKHQQEKWFTKVNYLTSKPNPTGPRDSKACFYWDQWRKWKILRTGLKIPPILKWSRVWGTVSHYNLVLVLLFYIERSTNAPKAK